MEGIVMQLANKALKGDLTLPIMMTKVVPTK
jgi:hypothetical protein